jgi:Spy/CpxP family protein refolding chaperone
MTILLCGFMINALMAQQPDSLRFQGKGMHHRFAPAPGVLPGAPLPPFPPKPPKLEKTGIAHTAKLDLPDITDEQKEKIKQADIQHLKAMTPLRNKNRELRAQLQTILTTTPFEAKAADQVADEMGKNGSLVLKEMIRHDQAIRALLTPQQQVIFDSRPKPFLRGKK